jgi:Fur family zinc uptake transcriptional regulator
MIARLVRLEVAPEDPLMSGARPAERGSDMPRPARFPARDHDHRACVERALADADGLCAERHQRMTAQRREVLEIILASHAPIGAYAILDVMRGRRGRKVAPPTAYRAIDFLRAQGLVHRIESLNAYVGCHHARVPHAVQLMICRDCRNTAELHDERVAIALRDAAHDAGFRIEERVVELSGLCGACAASAAAEQARGGARRRASEG